ncbi:BTB domain-containing protein [Sergentomyia squamirostris]
MPVNLEIQPQEEEVWRKERGPIKERLSYFVNNEFLSDMTFVVGEERTRIPAHKFILSTCSWEFYNALYLLQLDNNEVPIEDVEVDVFIAFLKYCYTGEINLSEFLPEQVGDKAAMILKLAYRFSMKHLIEICEAEITESFDIKYEYCLEWYMRYNFVPKHSKLGTFLLTVIARNFLFVIRDEMDSFLDLPLTSVRDIASHDQLTCDEMQFFDVLMKWASHNCEKLNFSKNSSNLRLILKDVFYKIRFPNMTKGWFIHILSHYPNLLSAKELSLIGLKIGGDSLVCENFTFLMRKNDTRVIKPSIDFSGIETNTVLPCFSNTLKFRSSSSRHFSTHFKLRPNAGDDRSLKGIALVVKKDQEFTPCYYCLFTEKEPVNYGPYKTRPEQAKTNITITHRCQINWDYDIVFLDFETTTIVRKEIWYRLYCEFDTELPYSYPSPFNDNSSNRTAQLEIWKEKISFIPYLMCKD